MPRLQVMNLPAPAEEYPFVLVVDEVEDINTVHFPDTLREQVGARAILVFEDKVEVV